MVHWNLSSFTLNFCLFAQNKSTFLIFCTDIEEASARTEGAITRVSTTLKPSFVPGAGSTLTAFAHCSHTIQKTP